MSEVLLAIFFAVIIYGYYNNWFAALLAPRQEKHRPSDRRAPLNKKKPVSEQCDVTIIFGSQSGTAAGFAMDLHREGTRFGVENNRVIDGEDYAPENLFKEKIVIFIVASFGEGDPTDSMVNMDEYIKGLVEEGKTDSLCGVKYSVFGLGDRQYKFYQKFAIDLDEHLASLGAERIYGMGMGDAGKDQDEEFDEWRLDLWPTIARHLGVTLKTDSNEPIPPELTYTPRPDDRPAKYAFIPASRIIEPTAKQPAYLKIISNEELLHPNVVQTEDRSTREIVLSLGDSAMTYQAGDHLGVMPENPPELVDSYLKILKVENPDLVVALLNKQNRNVLPAAVTIREALRWYTDLGGVPNKAALRTFAHYCTDPKERDTFLGILSQTNEKGLAEYRKLVPKLRTVGGFLRKFSSCHVPIGHFIEAMPRIQPRYFSIASDATLTPKSITIIVAVVKGGLCTTWLQKAITNCTEIPCFVRKSVFHIEIKNRAAPVIMNGPDIGVALFLGFLNRREAWKSAGHPMSKAMQFFGCRRESEDFIKREYMEHCLETGVLSKLLVAFSREKQTKVYVQQKIEEEGAEVWHMLKNLGAILYICGDSRYMAPDVEKSLISVIKTHGGLPEKAAEKFLQSLADNSRYHKDVWAASKV